MDGLQMLLDMNRDLLAIATVLQGQGHDVGVDRISARATEIEDFIASQPTSTDAPPKPGQPVEQSAPTPQVDGGQSEPTAAELGAALRKVGGDEY